ncbi:MAG: hypothetical protein U5R06_24170 [candidate division KSB1 bacterium]|nr:hypothetical protein [candidate division KSB1 bacterium]
MKARPGWTLSTVFWRLQAPPWGSRMQTGICIRQAYAGVLETTGKEPVDLTPGEWEEVRVKYPKLWNTWNALWLLNKQ